MPKFKLLFSIKTDIVQGIPNIKRLVWGFFLKMKLLKNVLVLCGSEKILYMYYRLMFTKLFVS